LVVVVIGVERGVGQFLGHEVEAGLGALEGVNLAVDGVNGGAELAHHGQEARDQDGGDGNRSQHLDEGESPRRTMGRLHER
jgi:hypothetical protein